MAYQVEKKNGYTLYHNEKGKTSGTSSCPIIEVDGYVFKDLEGTQELVPYADWRLDAETRATDLAKRLSVEEIAGLMMYSPHQMLPALGIVTALSPQIDLGPFTDSMGNVYDYGFGLNWDGVIQARTAFEKSE